MTSVETEADFQFPRVEDVIDTNCCPTDAPTLCGVCTGREPLSTKTGKLEVQRDAFGLSFSKIIVKRNRNA